MGMNWVKPKAAVIGLLTKLRFLIGFMNIHAPLIAVHSKAFIMNISCALSGFPIIRAISVQKRITSQTDRGRERPVTRYKYIMAG
jgi:hypothetical protein